MAEVGAMHGDISTFNNVDGYLEAMFREGRDEGLNARSSLTCTCHALITPPPAGCGCGPP